MVLCTSGYSQCSWVIFYFDVRSEKFCLINNDVDIPPGIADHTNSLTLLNYKGKLGIMKLREREVVLWHLEDATSHKWSKHIYILNPLGESIVTGNKFVGMTSTGELVWSSYSSHGLSNHFHVFFYNLERNTFTRVNIKGFRHHSVRRIHTFIDYVENMKFM
ncbi:unnamed protein product [Brassica rapa]|uniref:F-box associated beta-propeller type 3 domain-containing protein n=1 Tax=Brassica campestris TaxID=3711 RepID=A0A3P5Z7R4_BRACM|nr:unnamed protein product [Brassica rapa]VDC74829.1 unnamed protein product [Brassica rapa]